MACIKKVGDRWRADWRDKQGNRYRATFDRKRDAEDHLAKVKVDVKAGTYVGPKAIPTLREAAADWFKNKVGMKLRPSTLQGYQSDLENHVLKSELADLRLDQIGVKDVERFRDAIASKPVRRDGKNVSPKRDAKKLSPKMVNYILRDLQSVFVYAVKARLAAWNPVESVDRARVGADEHGEDGESRADMAVTESEVLSSEDCAKLIEGADEGFDRAFLMTAVSTGARHDELLALRWEDVDLDAGTLHFRRSLTWAKLKGEPSRPRFYDTKTGKKGNRKLPCPSALTLELKKWKLRCPQGDLDLVFPSHVGLPLHRSKVLRGVLHPTCKRAGVTLPNGRLPNVHTFRHTFCSVLLAQGTPPAEVQRYSGHARLSTLLDTYTHFVAREGTNAIERHLTNVLG